MRLYLPNQFTVREQEKKYVTYREISYTAPGKKYNVNNDNSIVMNYTSEQHEYPDTIIGDPVDKIYGTGSDTSWGYELVKTNIEPEPAPASLQNLALTSIVGPIIIRLGQGTFYATYSVYIKLKLYSKAYGSISEYVVISETVTFDN